MNDISDSGASCRAGISAGGDRSKSGGASASLGSIPILWRTASSVLQLSNITHQIDPYHLQLAQPSLQGSSV